MNRNQLAAFLVVAREQSVTAGARTLMVSQPAVSAQIGELERSLKVKLFDRLPRGVRLTAAGTVLLDYARRMEALEADAERAIEDHRGLRAGRLSIAASRTIGAYLLPEVLGRFRRTFPQIELSVEIANTAAVHRMVVDRSVEVALSEGVVEDPELTAKVFGADELIAVAPPGHPLSKKAAPVARVCRGPLIFRELGSGTRVVLERALATRRLTPRPTMSLGSPEAIKRAVMAGLGLAFLSRLVVADELASKRLVEIRLTDLKIPRPLRVVRLRDAEPSAAGLGFENVLGE